MLFICATLLLGGGLIALPTQTAMQNVAAQASTVSLGDRADLVRNYSVHEEKIGYNLSISNDPLTIGTGTYEKGISFHCVYGGDAYVEFDVSSLGAKYFSASVGVLQTTSDVGVSLHLGTIAFSVYGDGQLLASSPVRCWDDEGYFLSCSIDGVQTLKLVQNDVDGNACDQGVWGNARLTQEKQSVPEGNDAPQESQIIAQDYAYVSDMYWIKSRTNAATKNIRDTSANNELIFSSDGTYFPKGIGLRASSTAFDAYIDVNIEGLGYTKFSSYYGMSWCMDIIDFSSAGVKFFVIGDGTVLFESGVMNYGTPLAKMECSVVGVKRLCIGIASATAEGVDVSWGTWGGALLSKSGNVTEEMLREVKYPSLAECIAEAKTYTNASAYTADSYQTLQQAITVAESCTHPPYSFEGCLYNLKTAIRGLVDISELKELSDVCNAVNIANYTQGVEIFERARSNASAVLAKSAATKAEVAKAIADLEAARGCLKTEATKDFAVLGASIRTAAPSGLRFVVQMSNKMQELYADAKFGVMLLPSTMDTKETWTVAYDGTDYTTNVGALVIERGAWWSEELRIDQGIDADQYSAYSCALVGEDETFPEKFYNTPITAVGFAVVDGEVIYTSKVTRSISYMATVVSLESDYVESEIVESIASGAEVSLSVGENNVLSLKTNIEPIFTIGNMTASASAFADVTYTSNDSAIIKVENGIVKAVGNGTTRLTAILKTDGAKTLTRDITVTVYDIAAFEDTTTQKPAMAEYQAMMNNLTTENDAFPLSFAYAGTSYSSFKGFAVEAQTSVEIDRGIETVTNLRHSNIPALFVLTTRVYPYESAYEYMVEIKNGGTVNTGTFYNLSFAFDMKGTSPVLSGINGDTAGSNYVPYYIDLASTSYNVETATGRPTHQVFPYYNINYTTNGVYNGKFIALGWPGTFRVNFTYNATTQSTTFTGGQAMVNTYVKPGETLRTPLMGILSYANVSPDEQQNMWRKYYLNDIMRKIDGEMMPTYVGTGGMTVSRSTHAYQMYLDAFQTNGISPEILWMDAGWYGGSSGEPVEWAKTGSWLIDESKFPGELQDVREILTDRDIDMLLWFEPENNRLDKTAFLAANPDFKEEWFLGTLDEGSWLQSNLVDLGNTECLQWVTDKVSAIIEKAGVKVYRQDFNNNPAPAWFANDEENRTGMTENQYIQGYLAFWDALIERHEGLIIDSCASGGGRNDLESMKRAVPLHYSDYFDGGNCNDYDAKGKFSQALFAWFPYFKNELYALDSMYQIRMNYAAFSLLKIDNPLSNDTRWDLLRQGYAEYDVIRGFFYDDYYQLTSWSANPDRWDARMFYNSETCQGFASVACQEASSTLTNTVKFKGLDSSKTYHITDFDGLVNVTATGQSLMENGISITVPEKPYCSILLINLA